MKNLSVILTDRPLQPLTLNSSRACRPAHTHWRRKRSGRRFGDRTGSARAGFTPRLCSFLLYKYSRTDAYLQRCRRPPPPAAPLRTHAPAPDARSRSGRTLPLYFRSTFYGALRHTSHNAAQYHPATLIGSFVSQTDSASGYPDGCVRKPQRPLACSLAKRSQMA